MKKKLIIGLSGLAGSGKDFVANLLVEKHGFAKIALADSLKRICQDVFDFSDEQLWGRSEERNKPDKRYFTGNREGGLLAYKDDRILLYPEKTANQEEKLEPTHEEIQEACKIYLTPRFALQSLGDWARGCYPEVWINYTLQIVSKLLTNPNIGYDASNKFMETDCSYADRSGVVISDVRFRNEIEGVRAEGGKIVRIKRDKLTTLSGSTSLHSSEREQMEVSDNEFDYVLNNQESVEALQQELSSMLANWL